MAAAEEKTQSEYSLTNYNNELNINYIPFH